MSQFPHDDFAKAYLPELLRPIGIAIPNHPLKAESRFADLWFVRSNTIKPEDLNTLGLIATLLTRDSLIEVFRNAATRVEIRASQSKLSYQEIDEINQADRENKNSPKTISPGFGSSCPPPQRAGKQKKAIEELSQRPQAAPMTATIEDLLSNYRAILETRGALTPEDEELIMNLSTVYLKQRETWKLEARQETLETVAIALLREGVDFELIQKTTGIDRDTLRTLQSQLT